LGFVTWRRPSQIAIVGWTLVLTYLAVGIVTVNHIGTLWLFWTGVAAVGRGAAGILPVSSSLPRAAVAVPILATAAWIFASLPALAASHSAQTSNGYTGVGNYDRAIAAGRDAVATDGSRAIYWHYLAVAYTRQS